MARFGIESSRLDSIPNRAILTINLHDIYTAPCVMILRREIHITRGIARGRFQGPKQARLSTQQLQSPK